MSANTTRLNLYKPGGGGTGLILPDEVADIDKINGNMDLLDAAMGAAVVTSTARPVTPYSGQVIYETDTGKSYVRVGTSWLSAGLSRHFAATIAAMAAIPGAVSGDICFTSGIAGSTYGSTWIYVQGIWIPLGPILAVSFAALGVVQAEIVAAGATVLLGRNGTGALAVAAGVTYVWSTVTSQWTPASGWVPVYPSSTVGTSSGVGSIYQMSNTLLTRLNGVFSSAFDKYRVVVGIYGGSTACQPYFRLAAGGADNSAAVYDQQLIYSGGATTTSVSQIAAGFWQVAGAGFYHQTTLELIYPASALATMHSLDSIDTVNNAGGGGVVTKAGGMHRSATAFDGITIATGTGSMTGSIQVLAYAG